jgi:MFS family permease
MATQTSSIWTPLRHPVFRALWIASVASNVGTWMHNVGADWLMTTLAPNPFMLGLLQAAENAPLFLLALPAGALADIVDRRRLLLFSQAWMLVAAIALALLTLLGLTTPSVLLLLTFALGLGAALNAPVWLAIVPELVPRDDLPLAVGLNSIALNIARAVGPAIGGLIVAAAGSWAVFLLNSLSFIGILIVLRKWHREPLESVAPAERLAGAIRAGLRYVRHAPELRSVLARTAVFASCASALWALLPLVARQQLGLGAEGYGVLLGGLGGGAIIGAFALPRLRQIVPINILIIAGTCVFAVITAMLALVHSLFILAIAMIFGGVAWMTLMSSFNIAVQTVVPEWVRARALSIYLLVFYGSLAGGSIAWGSIASHLGIPLTLLAAAGMLLTGLLAHFFYTLPQGRTLDLSPSLHWTEPVVNTDPDPEEGPVLVMVEYQIEPERAAEFIDAMRALGRIRRRDGASRWGIFHDAANPGRYVETFMVESWGEHMRQHARVTNEDRVVKARARSFHIGPGAPRVSHLIADEHSKGLNGRRHSRLIGRKRHERKHGVTKSTELAVNRPEPEADREH